MKRTELVLVSMTLAFFSLYVLGTPGISIFMVLLLSLMGVLFGYFGFAHLNGVRMADVMKRISYTSLGTGNIVVAIVSGLGMGIVINGILFRVMFWEGSDRLLQVGLGWTAVSWIVSILIRKLSPILKKRIMLRSAIWTGLGIIFLAFPAHTWFALRYRNYPNYVEAMKNYRDEPSNSNYKLLEEARSEVVK